MPHSPQSTTVENVNKFIEPIAAITEIVKSNTYKHQPSYLDNSPNCIIDQAFKRESSPCVSPAKKRQKINYDNFPEINQTEISKMLLESIGKFVWVLYLKKLFLFQQK